MKAWYDEVKEDKFNLRLFQFYGIIFLVVILGVIFDNPGIILLGLFFYAFRG